MTRTTATDALLESLPDDVREQLCRQKFPDWTSPMLATLTHERFSDEKWIFERKLDGERCLAFREGDRVRLKSRNKKLLNTTYPELVEALETFDCERFIVDGEIVAFDGNVTSFSRLQGRMQLRDAEAARQSRIAVYYYVFDVLQVGEYDTTQLALRERKKLLRNLFDYRDPLRYTPHRNRDGEAYFEEACRKGWEGIIAKLADSRYRHSRSRDWLKFKCDLRQEFVIGGYTDPQGERIGFGALLIGYYEDGKLVYAGKVGTGYDDDLLKRLSQQLKDREVEDAPFADDSLPRKGVHWVKPKLVGEVGFTEWTDDGRLRHPRFLGLRRDKSPKEVHREKAR